MWERDVSVVLVRIKVAVEQLASCRRAGKPPQAQVRGFLGSRLPLSPAGVSLFHGHLCCCREERKHGTIRVGLFRDHGIHEARNEL